MKLKFIEHSFNKKSMGLITALGPLTEEYMNKGWKMTTRHAYYKLVSLNLIQNTEKSYNSVKTLIDNAKQAGLLDWAAFEDKQRVVKGDTSDPYHGPFTVNIKEAVMREVESCFTSQLWAKQTCYVEVYTEKIALEGLIAEAADERRVAYLAVRGYSSGQALFEAAERFRGKINQGKKCVLLYVGDHDSSGEDMVRDVQDRLARFGAGEVEVKKIALTLDQARHYNLPPQPLKESDTRSRGYKAKFGIAESWEADALDPDVLIGLVREGILECFNFEIHDANLKEESQYKREIWEKYKPLMKKIDEITEVDLSSYTR
jgi:hypothetical protein